MNPTQVLVINPYILSMFVTLIGGVVVAVITQIINQYAAAKIQVLKNDENMADHVKIEKEIMEERSRQDDNLTRAREEYRGAAERLESLMKNTITEQKETNVNLQKLIIVVQEVISNNRAITAQQTTQAQQLLFDQARLRDLEAVVSELKGYQRAKTATTTTAKVKKIRQK